VAVVIGAASGIGAAATKRLVEAAAHVVLADRSGKGMMHCDATNEESVERLFRHTVFEFGGLDILFYSAGISPELHAISDLPDGELDRQMAVHFRGAVLATRWASRIMIKQKLGGRLIYNASKAAFAPGRDLAAYGCSKAALVQFVRNAANDLGRYGITANYINADMIDTPLFRRLAQARAKRLGIPASVVLRGYQERSALKNALIPPQAVAEAVLFLASAPYTTGCVVTVGGSSEAFPR
jgi:NAD(P)-dependent dehydrogenase (short-subunit alcohol dehydrogenase family)